MGKSLIRKKNSCQLMNASCNFPIVPKESEIYSGNFSSSLWNFQREKKNKAIRDCRMLCLSSLLKGLNFRISPVPSSNQISWDQKPPAIYEKQMLYPPCGLISLLSKMQKIWTTLAICDGRPFLPVNYVLCRRRSIWAHQQPSIWKLESMCDSCNHLSWIVRSRLFSGFPQSIGCYLDILISRYL
jgi:hypothetical protein